MITIYTEHEDCYNNIHIETDKQKGTCPVCGKPINYDVENSINDGEEAHFYYTCCGAGCETYTQDINGRLSFVLNSIIITVDDDKE